MIEDILDYTQVDAGRADLELSNVNLRDILELAETHVTPQLRAKGVSFSISATNPSLVVRADPQRLVQVLVNLLSNAMKFTPAGGRIAVTVEEAGDTAVVCVADTGPGIAAEHLGRIFDPFYQVDRSLTRARGGIGLGLAISYDLVRAMNGEIRVTSTPGEGTEFTVALPRATPALA